MMNENYFHFNANLVHIGDDLLLEGMIFFTPSTNNELVQVKIVEISYKSRFDMRPMCIITMEDCDNNEYNYGVLDCHLFKLVNLDIVDDCKYRNAFLYNSVDDYFAGKAVEIEIDEYPINVELPFATLDVADNQIRATAYTIENGVFVLHYLDYNELGDFYIDYIEEGDEIIGHFDIEFSDAIDTFYISPQECGEAIKPRVKVKYLNSDSKDTKSITDKPTEPIDIMDNCVDNMYSRYTNIVIDKQKDSVVDILKKIITTLQ